MPVPVSGDIKVGDVGTVYFVPTFDGNVRAVNFDPSAAPTKKLIFKMPGASGLCERTAVAAQQADVSGSVRWGLQYTVTAADVAAWSSTSVGGFHQAAGAITIEAYVEFSASQKWSSLPVTTDVNGRALTVVARLSV